MIKEVDYDNIHFLKLCTKLEQEHVDVIAEQRSPNGNCLKKLDKYIHILLYFEGEKAIGCLAISKPINYVVEIGRLYVLPKYRNKKIASKLFEKAFTIIQQEGNKIAILNTYKDLRLQFIYIKN